MNARAPVINGVSAARGISRSNERKRATQEFRMERGAATAKGLGN